MNWLVLLAWFVSAASATLKLPSFPVAPTITEHRHPYGNGNPHQPTISHGQIVPPFYFPYNYHTSYPTYYPFTRTSLTRPSFVKPSQSVPDKQSSIPAPVHAQPQRGYGPANMPLNHPYHPYYHPGPQYPQYHYVLPYGPSHHYPRQYLSRPSPYVQTVPGIHHATPQIPDVHSMSATTSETPTTRQPHETNINKKMIDITKISQVPVVTESSKATIAPKITETINIPIIPIKKDAIENIPTNSASPPTTEAVGAPSSKIVRIWKFPSFPTASIISPEIRPTPELETIAQAHSRPGNEIQISHLRNIPQSDPTNVGQLATTAAPTEIKLTSAQPNVAPPSEVTTQQQEVTSQPIEIAVPSQPTAPIVQSAFSCVDRAYGYYADLDDCTVYHVCHVVPPVHLYSPIVFQRSSFQCGPGTVFSQLKRTCVHATSEMTCANAAINYSVNDDFAIFPETLTAELIEAQTNTFPALEPLNQRIKDGLKNPNSPFRKLWSLLPMLNEEKQDAKPIESE